MKGRVKMEQNKNENIAFILKLIHILVSILIFYVFWLLFRYGIINPAHTVGFRYNYFVTLGYGIILYFFIDAYNAYLLGYTRIRDLIFSQLLSEFFSIIILYAAVSVAWRTIKNPLWFVPMIVLQMMVDFLWSWRVNVWYYKKNPPKKAILIYRNENDKKRFGIISGKPVGIMYKITKELQYDGLRFKDIKPEIEGFEAILVAGINSRCRNGIIKYCVERNIPGYFLPHVGDVLMRGATHIQTFSSPVLYFSKKRPRQYYIILKRLFDIFASGLGIVILSPLMFITALSIKLYDGGPALYKQIRLTKNGKEFNILKFRSMRVDAEKDGIARLSSGENDNRITPIGKIVRKCRLDELPQLFNILIGDMSIVGPRPERPEIAEQYYKVLPDFKLRLQVKAGLTGYAQIYGKYNTAPYEKLEFDLIYINDMSILNDLKLIFATFGILFSDKSTEGVNEGQITAIDEEDRVDMG